MPPKVTVAIPAYNGERYLMAAVRSALDQPDCDLELIICDDASRDTTADICRTIGDPRMRYCRFETNGGQAVNWNRCLDAATGEHVVLLHQDDLLVPGYLARASAMLDTYPEVGLVHCAVQHIDAAGVPLYVKRAWPHEGVYRGRELWSRLLLEGCLVNPAGVMVRRSAYAAVGPFTTRVAWGIDWHMWLRLALTSDVGYLSAALACYREHEDSGTAGVVKSARNGGDELWVVRDVFAQTAVAGSELHRLERLAVRQVAHRTWCWAEIACEHGFMRAARAGVRKSAAVWPPMLLQSRVWGLLAATYLGYGWFARAHRWRRALGGSAKRMKENFR